MSARAAWRLEAWGYGQVYRYTDGKMDWLANGLPAEGEWAAMPQASQIMRTDVPTCRMTDRVPEIRERLRAAAWDVCVVVSETKVVLGMLSGDRLDSDGEAGDAMWLAPRTYRPNVSLHQLEDGFHKSTRRHALVTTSEGELIGLVRREDVERAIAAIHREERDGATPPS